MCCNHVKALRKKRQKDFSELVRASHEHKSPYMQTGKYKEKNNAQWHQKWADVKTETEQVRLESQLLSEPFHKIIDLLPSLLC